MPQKGQINHEWESTNIPSVQDCKYCDCTKVTYNDGQVTYRSPTTGNYVKKQPPCITRKTDTNEEDNNKA